MRIAVPIVHRRIPQRSVRRRGAAAVEFAVAGPVVLFVVLMQIVGAMGVFRYQEVAHLAREGARYASTHGGTYQREGIAERTGVAAVADSDALRTYLADRSALLDDDWLQVQVSWTAPSSITPANTPVYVDPDPTLVPPGQRSVQNNVIVTVTYQWTPELFGLGAITLTSTSQTPMLY